MHNLLNGMFHHLGIPLWGYCSLEPLLPLLTCRAAARVPQQSKAVLVCGFPYYTGEFPQRNVSRYAVGDDYHCIIEEILQQACNILCKKFPDCQFEAFVDNSPIREVQAAKLAGLGVVGRHGLLITQEYGSYIFLGTIVTTLVLPERASPLPFDCLNCGKCYTACPTGALQPGIPLQRELCRSHITQKKKALSSWEEAQIHSGGLVWGCDICQDICPMNQDTQTTPIPAFYRNAQPLFFPDKLEELTDCKAYNYRGREVLLRNYSIITNNRSD